MELVEINLDTEAILSYFGAFLNANRKVFLKSKARNDRAARTMCGLKSRHYILTQRSRISAMVRT